MQELTCTVVGDENKSLIRIVNENYLLWPNVVAFFVSSIGMDLWLRGWCLADSDWICHHL